MLAGGIWHCNIEGARTAAERLAPFSLAHRMFIVSSTGMPGSKIDVAEEVKLAGLGERMHHAHLACLAARNPSRLESEMAAHNRRQDWIRRLPLPA